MIRIIARTEPLSMKLRKVPAKRAERLSFAPSSPTNTLVAVHLDPSYLGIDEYFKKIRYLMNRIRFDHVFQLLTKSGYSLILPRGKKIQYWPPEGPFMANPPGDSFTIVGGYFQFCMKHMFEGLLQTLRSSRAGGSHIYIHFPLEAIFAAELVTENGETDAFPIPPSWARVTRDHFIPILNSQGVAYRIYYAQLGEKFEVLGTPKPRKKVQVSITFWHNLDEFIERMRRQSS